MAQERVERRLAAILVADMVGYSRLMEADEAGTIARQKAHRKELFDPTIAEHNGRIVKTTGDGLLIEFSSAVDAVEYAVASQQAIAEREADVPEDRCIQYRVGINVGDIVIDGDDILGDGVNVAARLEGLAEPGGICVSGNVHEQVVGKTDLAFDDMGEQKVKNIKKPVKAFAVRLAGGTRRNTGPSMTPALELPEKPSIAVLPFDNMSGDPEQEYFVDGIVEDVITELSRYHDLFVIARNSSFIYKGRAVDVKDAGRELGVHYIVEGSARKAGDRVRITVQLIDARMGHHLWAERYDRHLEDVFAVQDEISQMIVAALPRRLEALQTVQAKRKPPQKMAAYDYLLRAKDYHHRRTKEDNAKALDMAEKAIALDPEYGQAHAWWACIMSQAMARGYGVTMEQLVDGADELTRVLDRLSGEDFECHRILADINLFFYRNRERAQYYQDRAFALVPNDPRVVAQRGEFCTWLGRPDEAVEWIEKSMRLDPSEADRRAAHLGQALFVGRSYEEAIEAFGRCSPLGSHDHACVAACHAMLGRPAEADRRLKEAKKLDPEISSESLLQFSPYSRDSDLAHHKEAYAKAGLPPATGPS